MSEPNKFRATWVSHSSIGDFQKCPEAYYYRNVYKNPQTNRKMSVVSPYLSLGVAVHDVLEPLAWLPKEDRLNQPLVEQFLEKFEKYKGKIGGFKDDDKFYEFQKKGLTMIENLLEYPGPLVNPALRLTKSKEDLPWIWLSKEEEIIVSGKVDWIEYTENGVNIIDFKTGSKEEAGNSLQFNIYQQLIGELKPKWKIAGAYYWYVAFANEPSQKELPDPKKSHQLILEPALIIKEARQSKNMKCKWGGCRNCEPYKRILKGEGEFVGVGGYGSENYFI